MIGGFAQGAVIAMKVGLEYNNILGGIFSFSGFYSEQFINPHQISNFTPIFAHHGEKDPYVDVKEA